MHRVEPSVYVVAETKVDESSLAEYLEDIGAEGWDTDAPSGVEEIIEVMGRGCYNSFGVGLNRNVTRVREGNQAYIDNILKVRHGSVTEHGWVSFMFRNVSRVFTHELVRHRAGVAISQESLRFVRLDDLGCWIPSCFADNPKAVAVFEKAFAIAEDNYAELLSEDVLGFDIDKGDFNIKKELTSAARRVSPIGLATNIGWSCNIRALRHVIEDRTSPGAEEEMRVVFSKVAKLASGRWPNLFRDYTEQPNGSWCTDNEKI
jgi:thymidylate synthase (FAD)